MSTTALGSPTPKLLDGLTSRRAVAFLRRAVAWFANGAYASRR